jgi:hypothetical protein
VRVRQHVPHDALDPGVLGVERPGEREARRRRHPELLHEVRAVQRADGDRRAVAHDLVVAGEGRPPVALLRRVGRAERPDGVTREGVGEGVLGDGGKADQAPKAVVLLLDQDGPSPGEDAGELVTSCLGLLQGGDRRLEAAAPHSFAAMPSPSWSATTASAGPRSLGDGMLAEVSATTTRPLCGARAQRGRPRSGWRARGTPSCRRCGASGSSARAAS